MAGPKTPVDAPRSLAPTQGLIAVARATGFLIEDDARWEGGLSFFPDSCAISGVNRICDPDALTASENPDTRLFEPYIVWSGFKCSTFGMKALDWDAKVRRQLDACLESEIGAEFEAGALAKAATPDLDNAYLAHGDSDDLHDTPGTAFTFAELSQVLDAGAAACGCGGRKFIHMPPAVLSALAADGRVRREGGLWLTPSDNIVVASPGYVGTLPDASVPGVGVATKQAVYVTGPVVVRLGEVNVISGDRETVDRDSNDKFVIAARPVAAYWDGCCLQVAHVNAPVPEIAGTG